MLINKTHMHTGAAPVHAQRRLLPRPRRRALRVLANKAGVNIIAIFISGCSTAHCYCCTIMINQFAATATPTRAATPTAESPRCKHCCCMSCNIATDQQPRHADALRVLVQSTNRDPKQTWTGPAHPLASRPLKPQLAWVTPARCAGSFRPRRTSKLPTRASANKRRRVGLRQG